MAHIKYTGRSHIRTLASADLKKAGVEGFSKTDFPRNTAVEVEGSVSDAILSAPEIFGSFEATGRDAQVDTKAEKADASEVEGASSGAASISDTPTTSTRPTGRASTKSV